MNLTKNEKINILIAHDIMSIKNDINKKNYNFIYCVLRGRGWKQYDDLDNSQINKEFNDRLDHIKECMETLALANELNDRPIDLLKM
jgi:hypothetical protein